MIERRLLLGLLFCLVLVEPIRFEPSAESELSRSLGLADRRVLADIDGNGCLPFPGAVQMRDEIAAKLLEQPGIGEIRLAEPGEDNAGHRQVGQADDGK